MKYTVDYFIKKFEAIPENKWGINNLSSNGRKCALGFCGGYNTSQAIALKTILIHFESVVCLNDGDGPNKEIADNPKERILIGLWNVKLSGVLE